MATSNRKKPTGGASRAPAAKTTPAKKATPVRKTSPADQKTSAASARQGGNVSESAGSEKSAAKRLFDLRWLIAGMFVVYGIVLSVTGIFDSQAEIHKASGVRINLWTGIGMFVVGLVFAVWARWRPLRPE